MVVHTAQALPPIKIGYNSPWILASMPLFSKENIVTFIW